jgi:hypothetical protein
MIEDLVNSDLVSTIRLTLVGVGPSEREVEFEIDTGFNGTVSLDPDTINALGWFFKSVGETILAEGGVSAMDVHRDIVIWNGAPGWSMPSRPVRIRRSARSCAKRRNSGSSGGRAEGSSSLN